IYNYNQKIGFLNASSYLDQSIVLALNTENLTGLQVEYDAMVVRNPYVTGTTTNRINEMALQYRVGETGNFITLSESFFRNNTITRTKETEPLQTEHKRVTLPAE